MFNFQIINTPKSFVLKEEIIKAILSEVQNIENTPQLGILNIVFVSNDKMRELNKNYRKINKATDVLSFHYFDDFSRLDTEEIAWEIILSEDKIISQWQDFKLWSELEAYKLIIHSIFHILWYDHEKDDDYNIMKEKEEKIWNIIFS